jgi:hypothetical protein
MGPPHTKIRKFPNPPKYLSDGPGPATAAAAGPAAAAVVGPAAVSSPIYVMDEDEDEPVVVPHANRRRIFKSPVLSSGEESDDYIKYVKNLRRKTERDELKSKEKEYEDDPPSRYEEGDYRDGEEEEEEDDEEEEEEEEDNGRYVKEEVEEKSRTAPIRGKPNVHHCDRCVKKRQTCYAQHSSKSRGACFNCCRLKNKCIFSVSLLF